VAVWHKLCFGQSGRSDERLTETAKEIEGKYPVTIDQLKAGQVFMGEIS